jgi:hypothetical protein
MYLANRPHLWAHLPFISAFAALLPVISILVLYIYYPNDYTPVQFSYVIGSECPGVLGRKSTVGLPRSSVECVRVFIQTRAIQELREFVDCYVSSLLFYVYTIHTAMTFVKRELYRKIGQIVFCACVLAEGYLVQALYHRFVRYTDAFEYSALDFSNNLLAPNFNAPFYPLIKEMVLVATALRGVAVVVLLVAFGVCEPLVPIEHTTRLERVGLPKAGLFEAWLRRLYAFCLVVICSLCGFSVLQFYRPIEYTAEVCCSREADPARLVRWDGPDPSNGRAAGGGASSAPFASPHPDPRTARAAGPLVPRGQPLRIRAGLNIGVECVRRARGPGVLQPALLHRRAALGAQRGRAEPALHRLCAHSGDERPAHAGARRIGARLAALLLSR